LGTGKGHNHHRKRSPRATNVIAAHAGEKVKAAADDLRDYSRPGVPEELTCTCAIDYPCEQSFVDPRRIGVMGLSLGGTMATWAALCDERVGAANVIGYSDRFADFGIRDTKWCGSQITPGLLALCDVSDLHGLIAPRPLLVEIGAYDICFQMDSAMNCYREVEKIYTVAGARERLELDLFEGGHR
jgi:hypothetical protein